MSQKSNDSVTDKEIHILVKSTLMHILCALYESKLVKRVNMGRVVRIFGLEDEELNNTWVDFADPEFLESYRLYKNKSSGGDVNKKLEKYFTNPNRTLH